MASAASVSEEQLLLAATTGEYRFPANKYYVSAARPNAEVICDKCGTNDLTACINRGDVDLCLECASLLVEQKRMRDATELVAPSEEQLKIVESILPHKFEVVNRGFLKVY